MLRNKQKTARDQEVDKQNQVYITMYVIMVHLKWVLDEIFGLVK